jgi:hypothetical protein
VAVTVVEDDVPRLAEAPADTDGAALGVGPGAVAVTTDAVLGAGMTALDAAAVAGEPDAHPAATKTVEIASRDTPNRRARGPMTECY